MKKSLLVMTALLASMSLTAGNVTEQEALRKAQQFLQGRSFQQKNLRRSATANTFAQDAFYVFNADGNQGFVIVSADDRTESILGYADAGSLDLNNLPVNVAFWLQDYARQIQSLGDGVSLAAPHRAPGTEKVLLETAKWDQSAPYNGMCPQEPYKAKKEDTEYSYRPTYTGCTATGMAIAMQYYKWPESVKALDGYISEKKDGDANIDVPALPATTFDWENHLKMTYITKNGEKNYTEADSAEVAKLMRYCGQSVKMQYGSGSSSGSVHVNTLVGYFGYSSSAKEARRAGFSTEEWEKMIYDEIVAKRVVLYSGFNESSGHQFVIDGYDGKGFFHVNWGWGGSEDGYFTLATLNPDAKGIGGGPSGNGYPITQVAIFNLKKPETGDVASEPYIYNFIEIPDEAGYSKEYTRASSYKDFVDVKMDAGFSYSGITAPIIQYTLWAYKMDGTPYQELIPSGDYPEIDLSKKETIGVPKCTFGANWYNGTYEIRALYRIKGQTEWKTPRMTDTGCIVYATINGTKLTLSNTFPKNYGDISVSIVGDNVVYRPMSATVTWTRPQNNESNENMFYLWLKGVDKSVGGVSGYAAKGETETLTIAFKSTKVGEFEYYITSDSGGENVIYKSTDKINFRDIGKQVLDLSSWSEDNIKQEGKDGELSVTTFRPKLTIENKGTNAYDDYIECRLIPVDASGTATGDPIVVRKKITLAAGVKLATPAQAEFTGLKNNQRYKFLVYFYSNEEFPGYGMYYYYPYPLLDFFFTVNDPTGINAVRVGEKTDAPLFNLNGQRVSDNYKGIVVKNGKKYVVK